MSEIRITLDPVALREATAQAIMGILTPEVREKMLRDAISQLLTPSTNSWDNKKSPLETAFAQAVTQVAREFANDLVKTDPEIATKMKELMRQTADKVLSVDADKLAQGMADGLIDALKAGR